MKCLYVLAGISALLLSSVASAEEKTVKVGDWKMVIAPRETAPAKKMKTKVDPTAYKKIYNSIPFNRAEYRANPAYRHEATLEILFGEMRDTVIHKNVPQTVQRVAQPTATIPWRYNRNVARYGLNYSFYFPYWNARGAY